MHMRNSYISHSPLLQSRLEGDLLPPWLPGSVWELQRMLPLLLLPWVARLPAKVPADGWRTAYEPLVVGFTPTFETGSTYLMAPPVVW